MAVMVLLVLAVLAALPRAAAFKSSCTLYPSTGVSNGHDVARAPATTAQGCLQACELNSLCCIGEFDSKATKCYLKSGGQLLGLGKRPGSSAFNCTGTVDTCYDPVGPHPTPPPTPPAPPVPVTVAVDASATPTPFPPYWKRSFGSGHAAITLRPDWQRHLQRAVSELGLQGVRYHGLFDDDMEVVTGFRTYNFTRIKASWDYQLSLGLTPIVELSFMPALLANCSWTDPAASDPARQARHPSKPAGPPGAAPCKGTTMAYRGISMPPQDFDDWYDLVRALVQMATKEYGAAEVRKWSFEVWNELWGMPFPSAYMQLYNASALAVKSVDPSYKVGGPATAQLNGALGGVAAFVKECKSRGLPFDFVSTHFYPSSGDRTSFKPCAGGDAWDPACFSQQMALTRAAIPSDKEFLLTEYNAGCCMQYFQHDNSGAAAFAFRSIGELAGVTNVLSWWTFTDIFEEGNQIDQNDQKKLPEFSDVYGLMSYHGVPKPGWRAFALLHSHAGELRVPAEVTQPRTPTANASLISAFATLKDKQGLPSVFLSFWENGGPDFYRDNRSVTIKLKGAGGAAPTKAMEYRIDEEHANPLAAWQAMGSPDEPTQDQLDKLVAASVVKPTELEVTDDAVTLTMPPNSAVVVEFVKETAAESSALPTIGAAGATVCSIADHGATPGSSTVNTQAFRAASAACSGKGALGQRAVVLVPAGTWLTGAFNLSSHTELRLARGATIAAVTSVDRQQFPALAPFPSYGWCHDGGCPLALAAGEGDPPPSWCTARTQALVSAFDATDVVIQGAGSMAEADASASVLDGRGCWWWAQKMRKGGSSLRVCRPQLVNFVGCIGVEVTGVTLKDPPFWNLHLYNTSRVHIHNTRIHADQHPSCGAPGEEVRAVNSDGIDVDSSQDVLIERVYIEADDDAVAIKSGKQCFGSTFNVPTRNVTVRNCQLISNDFAIGSECSGGCEDIVLRDSVMSTADSDANTGCIDILRVKSSGRPGCAGFIRNILVKNVYSAAVRNSLGGQKHPDVFRFDMEGSGTPVTNLSVEDMHVDVAAGLAGQFYGDTTHPIRGLRLRNVTVAKSAGGWVCRGVDAKSAEFVDVFPPVDAKSGCLAGE